MRIIEYWVVWLVLCACIVTSNIGYGQNCNTSIVGRHINLSLSANCFIDIDASTIPLLFDTSTLGGNLNDYVFTIINVQGDTIPNRLDERHIDQRFEVHIGHINCSDPLGMSTVLIEDKLKPIMHCQDRMMTCAEFVSDDINLRVHECDLVNVQLLQNDILSFCGQGGDDTIASEVLRFYRAIDSSGNVDTCSERILVKRVQPEDVNFPRDITLSCELYDNLTDEAGNLIPPPEDLMPGVGNLNAQYAPGVPTTGSGSIMASLYGDQLKACRITAQYRDINHFSFNCKTTVSREWIIHEWRCDRDTIYRRLQTISFEDTIPPSFSYGVDTLRLQAEQGCELVIPGSRIAPPLITDNCASQFTTRFSLSTGGTYHEEDMITLQANDTVTVYTQVTDECGKNAFDSIVLVIEDYITPMMICIPHDTLRLTTTDDNIVLPQQLDLGSNDACSSITLQLQKMGDTSFVDTLNFTCQDSGTITVVMEATDESGNSNRCMVPLHIDRSAVEAACQSNGAFTDTMSINGILQRTDGTPIANATIEASSGNESQLITSDAKGQYTIAHVSSETPIQIKPQMSQGHLDGITTLDLIHLQRHILGIDALDSPYKVLAGDVTMDQHVNASDLVTLRRLLLGKTSTFAHDNYLFLPTTMEFENDFDPWNAGPMGYWESKGMSQSETIDFIGVKLGDVDESFLKAKSRNLPTYNIEYEAIEMGNFIEVSLYSPQEIKIDGWQGTLQFNPNMLTLLHIGTNEIGLTEDHYSLQDAEEGRVYISWNELLPQDVDSSTMLFSLLFQKEYDDELTMQFSDEALASEIYIYDDAYRLVARPRTSGHQLPEEFLVKQNVPNPWSENTLVEFNLPTAGDVSLQVYTQRMQKLYSTKGYFEAGKQHFTLSNKDIPHSGIYYCELVFGNKVQVIKMIKM